MSINLINPLLDIIEGIDDKSIQSLKEKVANGLDLSIIDDFDLVTVSIQNLDFNIPENQEIFTNYLQAIGKLVNKCNEKIINIRKKIRQFQDDEDDLDYISTIDNIFEKENYSKENSIEQFNEVINDPTIKKENSIQKVLSEYYDIRHHLFKLSDNLESSLESILNNNELYSYEFYKKIFNYISNNLKSNLDLLKVIMKYSNILHSYKTNGEKNLMLYHYTNISSLYSIFNNEELWFSDINYMNDSNEIKTYFSLINDLINNYLNTKSDDFSIFLRDHLKVIIKEFSNNSYANIPLPTKKIYSLPEYIYVLSLSTNDNSLFLWSNYGSSYTGLNFQVKENEYSNLLKDSLINKKGVFDYFVSDNVNYIDPNPVNVNNQIILDIKNIYEELTSKIVSFDNEDLNNYLISNILGFLLKKAIFTKDKCFKFEEEYRIALFSKNGTSVLNHRERNQSIVPFIKVSLPNLCNIAGKIMIGPINNSETISLGLNSYLNKNPTDISHYKETEIVKSKLPIRE